MFELTNNIKVLPQNINFYNEKLLKSVKEILELHYHPLNYTLVVNNNYEIFFKEPAMIFHYPSGNSTAFFGDIDSYGKFNTCFDTSNMDSLYQYFDYFIPIVVDKLEIYVREYSQHTQNNLYKMVKNVYKTDIYKL
jgi:hypothetical protein